MPKNGQQPARSAKMARDVLEDGDKATATVSFTSREGHGSAAHDRQGW
jgi:hypothetical protein